MRSTCKSCSTRFLRLAILTLPFLLCLTSVHTSSDPAQVIEIRPMVDLRPIDANYYNYLYVKPFPCHNATDIVIRTLPFDEATLARLAEQIAIESEGQPFEGKCAVAQCIYDRTKNQICSDGTVLSTLNWPGQFDYRGNYHIEKDVYRAIYWVFVDGNRLTEDRIIYFCNPKYVSGSTLNWFNSLECVYQMGGHCFYSDKKRTT